ARSSILASNLDVCNPHHLSSLDDSAAVSAHSGAEPMLGNGKRLPGLCVSGPAVRLQANRDFDWSGFCRVPRRCLLLLQSGEEFRGCDLTGEIEDSPMSAVITVEQLSKQYQIGHANHATTLREALADLMKLSFLRNRSQEETIWARRDRGHYRSKRGGEEHAPENSFQDHLSHLRGDQGERKGSGAAGSRHRLSPGADRPGKYLYERFDPRHAQERSRPQNGCDRRVLRC